MERPNTILGLTSHLVRQRWQALTPRNRMAVIAVAAIMGASSAVAVKAAMGGGCCASSSGCPMAQAHAGESDLPCHGQ